MDELNSTKKIKPSSVGKGRKKLRQPAKRKRQRAKELRYTPKSLPIYLNCGHNGKPGQPYYRSTLNMAQIRDFHRQLYSTHCKIKQDNFILKCCDGTLPIRINNNLVRKRRQQSVSIKYHVFIGGGKRVRVCKAFFLSITNLGRDRIERLVRNFVIRGEMPTERRGGDRIGDKNDEKKAAMQKFIESMECVESHYCRSKSTFRTYLPCELNFKKLWLMYNNSVIADKKVERSYFKTYVNKTYNIAFGTPLTDMCSTCLRSKEKLKNTDLTREDKNTLMTEQRIHKLKAKTFFNLLKEDNEGVEIFSFDCQKNLALPKLPDQSCYFSQQINFYNFTIVHGNSKTELSPETVFAYVWTELDAPKDSNAISSAVYHMLCKIQLKNTTTVVRLFADGCGGQNKNVAMMSMISAWLINKAPKTVECVEIIFPMVGHSFLPPDRVFGLIERKVKKEAVVVQPEKYENIIKQHATVLKLGEEWSILNWKEEVKKHVKLPGSWHFKFNPSKRFIFTRAGRNNVAIQREANYRVELGEPKGVTKRGHTATNLSPHIMPLGKKLKGDKSSISRLLATHYGENWGSLPELQFYKRVPNNSNSNETDAEFENESGCVPAEEVDLMI